MLEGFIVRLSSTIWAGGGGGRLEQVKLLRSEHAAVRSIQSQFSRTLFVANLPPVRAAAPAFQPLVSCPCCVGSCNFITLLPGFSG